MRTTCRSTGATVAALLLASSGAAAQTAAGQDLARRTFQNAEQLMRDGKPDQALKDYQQVIDAFPTSPLADDALLKVGSYHYSPESIGELGTIPVDGQEKARALFDKVRERYADSDSTPHALYKLGLLDLEPDSPRRNLDSAYGSFYRVVNIYPDSEWVGKALLGAAAAEIGKHEYDKAILSLERSIEEEPNGASAAESQYFLGLANARLGDFVRAAEAFQACRIENDKSRTAQRALDWLTLIYTMRLRPAAGAALDLAHDGGFVPRLGPDEDIRGEVGLAVTAEGRLLVADPRRGALMEFAEDGSRVRSDPFEGASLVSLDASENVIVASPGGIRVGTESFPAARKAGSQIRRIEEAAGVWRSSTKETYVLDLKEGELLRYGGDPADPKVVHRDKDAGTRVEAMAGGPEDRLFLLDRKGKNILVLQGGKVTPLVPPGAGPALEEPVALGVSALGDVYVADARQKSVIILSPEGKRLGRIAPAVGSPGEIASPAALAVGPRGEVYVYDERKRTVLRFR